MDETARLLTLLSEALREYYHTDPTTPGVLLAWVEDRRFWYASAQRFKKEFGRGKEIVAQGRDDDSPAGALRALARNWLERLRTGPAVGRLAAALVPEPPPAAPELPGPAVAPAYLADAVVHLQRARDALLVVADHGCDTGTVVEMACVRRRVVDLDNALRVLGPIAGRHPVDLQPPEA